MRNAIPRSLSEHRQQRRHRRSLAGPLKDPPLRSGIAIHLI